MRSISRPPSFGPFICGKSISTSTSSGAFSIYPKRPPKSLPSLNVAWPLICSVAKSLASILEPPIFCVALTSAITLALNLCVIELTTELNFARLVAFNDTCVIVLLAFMCFYIAEWISVGLMEIGDNFYGSEWYRLLPAGQQRLLLLPIQRAQRLFRLKAMGLFECSLAVFASVRQLESFGNNFCLLLTLN